MAKSLAAAGKHRIMIAEVFVLESFKLQTHWKKENMRQKEKKALKHKKMNPKHKQIFFPLVFDKTDNSRIYSENALLLLSEESRPAPCSLSSPQPAGQSHGGIGLAGATTGVWPCTGVEML